MKNLSLVNFFLSCILFYTYYPHIISPLEVPRNSHLECVCFCYFWSMIFHCLLNLALFHFEGGRLAPVQSMADSRRMFSVFAKIEFFGFIKLEFEVKFFLQVSSWTSMTQTLIYIGMLLSTEGRSLRKVSILILADPTSSSVTLSSSKTLISSVLSSSALKTNFSCQWGFFPPSWMTYVLCFCLPSVRITYGSLVMKEVPFTTQFQCFWWGRLWLAQRKTTYLFISE